jgi:hypothetical protein
VVTVYYLLIVSHPFQGQRTIMQFGKRDDDAKPYDVGDTVRVLDREQFVSFVLTDLKQMLQEVDLGTLLLEAVDPPDTQRMLMEDGWRHLRTIL